MLRLKPNTHEQTLMQRQLIIRTLFVSKALDTFAATGFWCFTVCVFDSGSTQFPSVVTVLQYFSIYVFEVVCYVTVIFVQYRSITFCGYWYLENPDDSLEDITVRCPSNCPSSSSCNLPQFLWDLNGNKEKPVFINFGSMEELGFFDSLDDVELIGTLNEGQCEWHIYNLDLAPALLSLLNFSFGF